VRFVTTPPAGASEDQVAGVGAGWELSTDGRDDLGCQRDLADAGVALGPGLEAAAKLARLVADVHHLEMRSQQALEVSGER
jgi:hypothetical protein